VDEKKGNCDYIIESSSNGGFSYTESLIFVMKKKLIHAVLLLLLIPTIFACRHPIETDPGQSPEITNLKILPEAVCGSSMVSFTLTDPNNVVRSL
jgi:hypothetical protein